MGQDNRAAGVWATPFRLAVRLPEQSNSYLESQWLIITGIFKLERCTFGV